MNLYEILYEQPTPAGLKPKTAYTYVVADNVEEAIEKSHRSRRAICRDYVMKQIFARGEVILEFPDTLVVKDFEWLGSFFR